MAPPGGDGDGEDRAAEQDAGGAAEGPYKGGYRAGSGPRVAPPYPSRVDLHTHSRRSDGVLEPRALVEAAAAAGVRLLALSDHDTLAGVRELAGQSREGPGLPLELLPAVEINSVAAGIPDLWEGELHILGLGVDPADDAFEAALERQCASRASRFREMAARLRELGMPVDAQIERMNVPAGASLGRPQMARALVAAGYAASVDAAMKTILARGKPGYVPRRGLGPREAIQAIAAARGVPVLAHFADAPQRGDLVGEMQEWGLRGLEVHYRHFDADVVAALAAFARDRRLVPTGGSDYHGDVESYAEAHAGLFVPDSDAAVLLAMLDAAHPDFPLSVPLE